MPCHIFAENLSMGAARFIMHTGYFAPYGSTQNATKSPIYDFVLQPRNNDLETVIKVVFMLVQSRGSS